MKKNEIILYMAGCIFFVFLIFAIDMEQQKKEAGEKIEYKYAKIHIKCMESDFDQEVAYYRQVEKGRIMYKEKLNGPRKFLAYKGKCEVREKSKSVILHTCSDCKNYLFSDYETEENYSRIELD